ncbi:MAG: hypothetical protein JWR51_3449 [Devosia sp.]|uniref:response regulator n=1 Tax=Devosia sp. TaxID=1871048 RepID=UPI0026275548|nr:response regulator [Devosia sp.]MDB5530346.1 hypothetical protein [Devosia sp.]
MPSNGPLPAILVVEDEFLILSSTANDLRDAGFTVFEASNADDAIALLETHAEIRILFTDVDMPGSMNGLKLSAAVRDRWPPILIIVTSGKTPVGGTELPTGGRFFPKPYNTNKIASAMQEMLA